MFFERCRSKGRHVPFSLLLPPSSLPPSLPPPSPRLPPPSSSLPPNPLSLHAQVTARCPGTRLRSQENREYHTEQQRRGHWTHHYGWKRGPCTNSSAGCTMILSRRAKMEDLHCTVIAGRGRMVRPRSGRFDSTVQVGYPTPLTESGARRRAQEKAIKDDIGVPPKKKMQKQSSEARRLTPDWG